MHWIQNGLPSRLPDNTLMYTALSILIILYFIIVTTASRSWSNFSGWFCSLNSIHLLKKKWTIILIEGNIEVISLKQVHTMGWWTKTYYFMNGKIYIMRWITDIQNTGSESMNICNRNVDYELVSICHWTLGLINKYLYSDNSHLHSSVKKIYVRKDSYLP